MKARIVSLLVLLLCAATGLADEIHLKDGSKIVGTVIGFEDNSFRVQTSFGIVTFPKNTIASIIPSAAAPSPAASSPAPSPTSSTAAPSAKTTVAAPLAATTSSPSTPAISSSTSEHKIEAKKETPPAIKKIPDEKTLAIQPVRAVTAKPAVSANAFPPVASPAVSIPAVERPDTPAASKAPDVPAMREAVRGNQYLNYTYGFRMYKAPSWNLIDDDTRNTLPNAIVALGASDDSTLMVVGVERTRESIESRAAATEKRLREIYENYRRTAEQKSTVAGAPAIERRYRGTADGRDWSGIVVTLARGNEVYTLLGMTYADSDLIQIQENVIARAIASLEFGLK